MKARGTIRLDPYKNKLEREYAQFLDLEYRAGKIAWFCYEGIRFLIGASEAGKDPWYKPDFPVMLPDRTLQCHETKGYTRGDREGMLKIKIAAKLYPVQFVLVTKVKGQWVRETI